MKQLSGSYSFSQNLYLRKEKLGMGLKEFGKKIFEKASEHSQTVMGIGAVAGLIGVVILTYKKSPRIHEIISEQREKVDDLEERAAEENLPVEEVKQERKEITKETVKRLAPEVAPIGLLTAATGGLMVGSVITSEMKISHIRDLLTMSEVYNKEILEKAKEVVGEEKVQEIKEGIAQDHANEAMKNDPNFDKNILQAKGGGKTLYWDDYMGRTFYCDDVTIEKAVNKVNKRILDSPFELWLPLNSIYEELELPRGDAGKYIGAGGSNCDTDSFDLLLNHAIKLDDGRPAIVFTFFQELTPEYSKRSHK